MSLVEYNGKLPYKIIDDHFFERASENQIAEMHKFNESFQSSFHHPIPYEHEVIEVKKGGSLEHQYDPLPKDKLRYWVINFQGQNDEIQPLEIAFSLLPTAVRFGYMVSSHEIGETLSYNGASINTYYMQFPIGRDQVSHIEEQDLKAIGRDCLGIIDAKLQQNSTWISLLRYHQLRAIQENSEQRITGLFSVIEALITHRPKLVESIDSITHQIFRKVVLIQNRSEVTIDYSGYFGDAKPQKIWTLLYAYRSRLVHGDWVKFDGELTVLKSASNVYGFLNVVVKMLLKQAIIEPALILDLKQC